MNLEINITMRPVQELIVIRDVTDETIIITLSCPTNANLGTNTQYTYTIIDNDAEPDVQFSCLNSSGSEASSPANIEVRLSSISGQDVIVNYTVADGTAIGGGIDYTLANGSVTIFADSICNFIHPVIVNDAFIEGGETFIITLTGASGANLGTDTIHTFTIQ